MLPLGPTHRPLRPVLVPLSDTTTLLKLRHEAVLDMVDCGELRWVWNIARAGASRAEYRFWLGEIFARIGAAPLTMPAVPTLDVVIRCVIGRDKSVPHLHSESVADLLGTRRQVVHAWLATGELAGPAVGRKQYVTRASLEAFLTRRIAGAMKNAEAETAPAYARKTPRAGYAQLDTSHLKLPCSQPTPSTPPPPHPPLWPKPQNAG